MRKKILLPDEAATEALGTKIAQSLTRGTFLALRGDLGAGKTVLVRGLARGLGITGRIASPTFTILCQYEGSRPLYHFDLYRVTEQECVDLGFDDFFYDPAAVCAVEWSERLSVLPPVAMTVTLTSTGEDSRLAVLEYPEGLLKGDAL